MNIFYTLSLVICHEVRKSEFGNPSSVDFQEGRLIRYVRGGGRGAFAPADLNEVFCGTVYVVSFEGLTRLPGTRAHIFHRKGADMAKYTASIDEDTRQRILSLPKGVHFSAFMRRAIIALVEELEKDPDLEPDDFIISRSGLKDGPDRARK